MAIKIKNLERVSEIYSKQQELYKDIALDLGTSTIQTPGFNVPVPGKDLKVSFNLEAIKNSLQNLFNTLPGQRFLFPEYGLDLYRYLFTPITKNAGQSIGEDIVRAIERFETRVRIANVSVVADSDNSQYLITIAIQVPSLLNTITKLDGILNIKAQSFVFLPTSRNN
jgi:phage baseplate assembly protein W